MSKLLLLGALCGSLLTFAGCGKTYEAEQLPYSFELKPGVQIHVEPAEPFQPASWKVGDTFAGVLATPLYFTREDVDAKGNTFERKTLVAPEGAPVGGIVVERGGENAETAHDLGLKVTSITFEMGRSFPVETDPVYDLQAAAQEGGNLTFTLNKPADVALVIEFRETGKKTADAR